jgi:hypothetical protein
MVQAQKQTQRPKEQNRRPRHNSTQVQTLDILQKSPKHKKEKKISSSTNVSGKIEYLDLKYCLLLSLPINSN